MGHADTKFYESYAEVFSEKGKGLLRKKPIQFGTFHDTCTPRGLRGQAYTKKNYIPVGSTYTKVLLHPPSPGWKVKSIYKI
jgi:hypothetical protein